MSTQVTTGRFVSWQLVALIFVAHASLRFGGVSNPLLVPLSLVMLWPLPWLLLDRYSRQDMGLQAPASSSWYWIAPLVGFAGFAVCAAVSWLVFGASENNWLTMHSLAMQKSLEGVPAGASPIALFAIIAIPSMLFSPLGEELFYRGLMQRAVALRWSERTGMVVQASAFALVHLAHYGLVPFQPALMIVWLPSMFAVAWLLGWLVVRSRSIWIAVIAHAAFNLGMSVLVFL